MFGGPLADRHGRVVVIDSCIVVMILLTFANLLMTNFWSFVIIRGSMNLVAGLAWGALGGLTRDMSPRTGRGAAFGLLTLGAVACLWLWNEVPAMTLPIFHTWQSQIVIMGVLAIVLFIAGAVWPEGPRAESAADGDGQRDRRARLTNLASLPQDPPRCSAGFRQLLGHWESWVLVIGVVAFLTTAITIQSFGPLMFTQAYHYSPAMADEVTARFWLINLVMLVPAGLFSDWLRVRKPITIVLSLVGVAITVLVGEEFLSAASARRNRNDCLGSGRSAGVGLYTVVRIFFGISRRPVAGDPGDRMVVFPDGLSDVDRLLGAAVVVGRGALRLADLDVGDGQRTAICSSCRIWPCAVIGGPQPRRRRRWSQRTQREGAELSIMFGDGAGIAIRSAYRREIRA